MCFLRALLSVLVIFTTKNCTLLSEAEADHEKQPCAAENWGLGHKRSRWVVDKLKGGQQKSMAVTSRRRGRNELQECRHLWRGRWSKGSDQAAGQGGEESSPPIVLVCCHMLGRSCARGTAMFVSLSAGLLCAGFMLYTSSRQTWGSKPTAVKRDLLSWWVFS